MALLAGMRARGVRVNHVAYTTLIDTQSRAGNTEQAEELLKQMERDGCEPNTITFSTLLRGHCMKGDLDGALAAFAGMLARGLEAARRASEQTSGDRTSAGHGRCPRQRTHVASSAAKPKPRSDPLECLDFRALRLAAKGLGRCNGLWRPKGAPATATSWLRRPHLRSQRISWAGASC